MANKYASLNDLFTGIANSIRGKTGSSESIIADDFPEIISTIETGADISGVTATAADVLSPKVFVDSSGVERTGTMATATQATPSISVSSAGLITASSTQTAGYVAAGTKSATNQLTVQAAKTVTPSTSSQTAVAAGRYTTGAITVAAIPSSYAKLNFTVVGGTTQPTSPTENMIWVNTSTSITRVMVYPSTPSSPSEGWVWIKDNSSAWISPNADVLSGGIYDIRIFPTNCRQYIGGAWVTKDASIYKSGAFTPFSTERVYLYKQGDNCSSLTGGYTATGMKCASSNGGNANTPTITYNANNMTITNYGQYASGLVRTTNKIDFSKYKTLRVKGSSSVASGGQKTFHVWTSIGSYTNSNLVVEKWLDDTIDMTIDISSLTSSYYVGFECVSANYSTCTITITEMWMEE